jgi:formylglycine-generating enzyme required for sulfatase activity
MESNKLKMNWKHQLALSMLVLGSLALLFISCKDKPDEDNSRNTGGKNHSSAIEQVWINAGTFTMGSPSGEPGRYSTDETQHQVTLTNGFYMGKYQVTQAQYESVMGTNPSNFKTPVAPETSTGKRPVEMVTWFDAIEFCNKLSVLEELTPVYTITGRTPATGYPITDAAVTQNWVANGYRLPTEAQWEYACRGKTTTAFNNGNDDYTNASQVEAVAWYTGNSGGRTHEAGLKTPNAWGLYDMNGNVYEWCWDWYDSSYYSSSSVTDPQGASSGANRVVRGGNWSSSAQNMRSAFRFNYSPDDRNNTIGFRILRP